MKKKWLYSIGSVVLLASCIVGFWLFTLMTTVIQTDDFNYYLRPGSSKKVVITELSQQGVIHYPGLFSLYILFQKNKQLKTGEYHFPKGSNLITIWGQITTGKGLVYHHFTIVPGWSFVQLKRELLKTPTFNHQTANMTDQKIMMLLGYANVSPEGQFFPETYYYTRGDTDLSVLKRAIDLMQSKLFSAWETRASGLPYKTSYEALIAASLIEKEAYLNSERPVIAGVLVNRLRKDMLLQFDPTVIYGMGDRYQGKIHKEDLMQDTPYNTYTRKGLPPTPIAMPGMTSIDAALHPLESDYLYFVARGDGSHQFSKTLPEHNSAVNVLVKQHPSSNFNETKVKQYILHLISFANLAVTPGEA